MNISYRYPNLKFTNPPILCECEKKDHTDSFTYETNKIFFWHTQYI